MASNAEGRTTFVKAAQIHGRYSEMIGAAKDRLTLVFPWFTASAQLKDQLIGALNRDVRLTVVTRPPEEARSLEHDRSLQEVLDRQRRVIRKRLMGLFGSDEFDLVEVLLVENIHAKCVIQDESAVLVTSSNLNETSLARNTEFGICSSETSAVKDALAAVDELRHSDRCRSTTNGRIAKCACGLWVLTEDRQCSCARSAGKATVAAQEAPPAPTPTMAAASTASIPTSASNGFCVRCHESLPRNREKPLCSRCYKSWARYKNPEFEEKHCHHCGREAATTVARPLCRTCYGAAS